MLNIELLAQYRDVERNCTTCRMRKNDGGVDVCTGFQREVDKKYVCGTKVYRKNPAFEETSKDSSKVTADAHPLCNEVTVKVPCPNYKPTIPVLIGKAVYNALAPVLA